jgi:hypothetical protein
MEGVCVCGRGGVYKVPNSAIDEFPLQSKQGNFRGPIIEVLSSSSVTNSDYPWGKK